MTKGGSNDNVQGSSRPLRNIANGSSTASEQSLFANAASLLTTRFKKKRGRRLRKKKNDEETASSSTPVDGSREGSGQIEKVKPNDESHPTEVRENIENTGEKRQESSGKKEDIEKRQHSENTQEGSKNKQERNKQEDDKQEDSENRQEDSKRTNNPQSIQSNLDTIQESSRNNTNSSVNNPETTPNSSKTPSISRDKGRENSESYTGSITIGGNGFAENRRTPPTKTEDTKSNYSQSSQTNGTSPMTKVSAPPYINSSTDSNVMGNISGGTNLASGSGLKTEFGSGALLSPRKQTILRYKKSDDNVNGHLLEFKDRLRQKPEGEIIGESLLDMEQKVTLFKFNSSRILVYDEQLSDKNTTSGRLLSHGTFEIFQLHNGDVTYISCGPSFIYPLLPKLKILRISFNQFILPLSNPERYWKIFINSNETNVIQLLESTFDRVVQYRNLHFLSGNGDKEPKNDIDVQPDELGKLLLNEKPQTPPSFDYQRILSFIPESPPSAPISPHPEKLMRGDFDSSNLMELDGWNLNRKPSNITNIACLDVDHNEIEDGIKDKGYTHVSSSLGGPNGGQLEHKGIRDSPHYKGVHDYKESPHNYKESTRGHKKGSNHKGGIPGSHDYKMGPFHNLHEYKSSSFAQTPRDYADREFSQAGPPEFYNGSHVRKSGLENSTQEYGSQVHRTLQPLYHDENYSESGPRHDNIVVHHPKPKRVVAVDELSESSMDSLLDEYDEAISHSVIARSRQPSRQPSRQASRRPSIALTSVLNRNPVSKYYNTQQEFSEFPSTSLSEYNRIHNQSRQPLHAGLSHRLNSNIVTKSRRSSKSDLYASESTWMEPNPDPRIPKLRSFYGNGGADLNHTYRNIYRSITQRNLNTHLDEQRAKGEAKINAADVYKMIAKREPERRQSSFASRLFGW